MPIDIVCGMEVPTTTKYKTIYKGKIYYFCCEDCLKSFEEDPEHYIKHGPEGHHHA
ncbi:MAG: YHS domain-containing protein [Acidilobaceae archaeon]